MAVGYIKRVAGPFTGAGTVSLPFGFVVYKETDIYVALASGESATHTLEYGTDYTVTLNDDQETTPGGTVTLTTPLVDGEVVAVGSALEYNQPTQLTNFSRFPPEIINEALDRIVILIQQLVEKSSRAITTDITDTMSAGELKAKLLSSAEDAAKSAAGAAGSASAAAGSASAAAASAQEAKDAAAQAVAGQVNANWTETDATSKAYIRNKPTLKPVATSGSYNDLDNKPALKPVATSGSYDDLENKPSPVQFVAQTLTTAQKTQARTNIDAVSESELKTALSELIVEYGGTVPTD